MRVVVVGGSGFIGRQVCSAFAAAGHEVLALVRRPLPLPSATRSVVIDPLGADSGILRDRLVTERPAVVVNATGAAWGADASTMTRTNVTLVDRLVTAVAAVPGWPRLVQLGSAIEYGPSAPGTSVKEDSPCRPNGAYGRTKLLGTEVVLAATRTGRIDGTVLRVFNATGPGSQDVSLPGRVAATLAAANREGRPAALRLAPLTASRDFVDVRDVAEAVLASAGASHGPGPFNVGSGVAVGVRSLVHRLIAISGVPADIVEEERWRSPLSIGLEWQRADITAARDQLGWSPRRRLDESLRALWERAAE